MSETTDSSGWGWLGWMLLGLALIAAGFGAFKLLEAAGARETTTPQPRPAPLVRIASIEAVDAITITQNGFVRSRFAIDIAAEVGGRIETVNPRFRVGDLVSAGTPLVSLRKDRFDADVKQAEASVAQARAAVEQATATFERQSELASNDFASEARVDEARTGRAQAEAQLALAEANLVTARIALEDTVIEAPYDAKIVERTASPGQIVQPGVPFGRLVSAEAVEVSVGLTPADLRIIGDLYGLIGKEVTLQSADDDGIELASGRIVALDPEISAGTRTTDVVVEVSDPFDRDGRILRLNALVTVAIPVPLDGQVLTAPALAVKAGNRIWRVEADQTITARDVTILRRLDDRVVFTHAELNAGDRILLTDLAAPVEGQTVRVHGEDGEAQAARIGQ